jgi:hypothetical protein
VWWDYRTKGGCDDRDVGTVHECEVEGQEGDARDAGQKSHEIVMGEGHDVRG